MTTSEPPNGHHQLVTENGDDLLWRHLKSVPTFRALLRAVEARFYRQIDIPEPILDLGGGDGHFAQMAFDRPLTAAIDPWWGPLQKAKASGTYRLNVQALGHALPFPNHYFNSVISNSVLEHIPQVQPVLVEANRVLKPGGKLVITMPSHLFTEYLGGAQLLRPLGLADAYRRFFNRISRHAHTDPPEQWATRLAQAGFQISRWQYYFSPGALRALEWGHIQGVPSAIIHFVTGHWILAPWRDNLRPFEHWVRPYYEEPYPEEGAYLFIVAQKVAEQPIQVQLPEPRPLSREEPDLASPIVEPAHEDIPKIVPAEPSGTTAISTPPSAETPIEYRVNEADEPTASISSNGLVRLGLLALGLLLSVLAQSSFSTQGTGPSGGLYLYSMALLAFASAAYFWRKQLHDRVDTQQEAQGQFPYQRWLYPLALLLALTAQNQAGSSLFDGHPLLAFLLWFLGVGVGYYALRAPSRRGTDPNDEQDRSNQGDETGGADQGIGVAVPPIAVATILFVLALLPRLLGITGHPGFLNGVEASIGLDALGVLQGYIRNPFATAWLTNPTLPLYFLAFPLGLLGPTVLGVRVLPALIGAFTVPMLYVIARRLWTNTIALVAAVLLLGYHLHLHYSRLGMGNIWDPLLALIAFGTIAFARQEGTRQAWLRAGLAVGFSAYFYTPSHLMPFFLLGLLVYFVLFDGDTLQRQGRHMLAAVAFAFVVALPQIVYYNANSTLFMERANMLGILHSDWLAREAANTGQRPLSLLTEQFWKAMLAFHYSLDTSSSYNPGIPLLRFWPALFFTIGFGLSIVRLREWRYGLLLIWLGVTLLFAGALLVDAPDSHRLLIATPAVLLLVVIGLHWLVQQFWGVVQSFSTGDVDFTTRAQSRLRPVLLLIAALIVVGDLLFYFGDYRASARFGDRNTEIAYEMATYLQSLDGSWTAYFHGPPAMYVSFPTIPFVAGEKFQTNVNLFDVVDPGAPLPAEPPPENNLVFLYLPERSNEAESTLAQYPGGTLRSFEGTFANPLFYAYEVRR